MSSGGMRDGSYWQQMEAYILIKIFMSLSILDIVNGVSCVCRSWRAACRDPNLWATVNLNKFGYYRSGRVPMDPYSILDGRSGASRLLSMLKTVSNLGGNNVRRLIFNYSIDVRDEHLVFAARRFPGLKHLALPYCNGITVPGFHAAIQNWTGLESLIVDHICNPCEIFQLIGAHCKNFYSLKIMFSFDIKLAMSLYINIPGLKILSVKNTFVEIDALNYFLTLKQDLVSLNIAHNKVVSDRRTPDSDDVSLELVRASRIREFYRCNQRTCITCQSRIGAERSLRHDMELWKRDEIASLCF